MAAQQPHTEFPPLVTQAVNLARQLGFEHSCLPEVGRLLFVLAGSVRAGTIGEIGTGCGVGAAWIASALTAGPRFLTVELDPEQAASASTLLQPYPAIQVLHSDWHALLSYGPFDLLFVDATPAKYDEPESVVAALRPGGMVMLDDLTPPEYWPEEWHGQPDALGEFWLTHKDLRATELRTTPPTSVILATRIA